MLKCKGFRVSYEHAHLVVSHTDVLEVLQMRESRTAKLKVDPSYCEPGAEERSDNVGVGL